MDVHAVLHDLHFHGRFPEDGADDLEGHFLRYGGKLFLIQLGERLRGQAFVQGFVLIELQRAVPQHVLLRRSFHGAAFLTRLVGRTRRARTILTVLALRALLTFGTIRAILIRTTLGTGAARPEGVLIPFVGDAGAVVAAASAFIYLILNIS